MIYGSNFKQKSTDSYSYQNIKGQKIINIDTDLECYAMRIILCLINELCDQISNIIYDNTLLDSITVFRFGMITAYQICKLISKNNEC